MRHSLALLFAVLMVTQVKAESPLAELAVRLENAVPKLLEEGQIPGAVIAVGVRRDGAGGGYETIELTFGDLCVQPQRRPMTADAVFDLASMTKPIAAGTSMMILIERGKAALDDPVARYLPQFDQPGKREVTIRHLLTHSSGLKSYLSQAERKELQVEHGAVCPAATRTLVRNLSPSNPPGQKVVYSCLNAIVVAELVEAISGKPLDVFAQEELFKPLGMTDTGFNPPESLSQRLAATTRAPHGRGEGGFLLGQVHDPIAAMQGGMSGNAGLFSTSRDLSRYAQMILNGGELDGVRILDRSTVTLMTSVQNAGSRNAKGEIDRRGLSWDVYDEDASGGAVTCFGHTGYTGTAIRFYPQRGTYAIALTNRVHPDDSGNVGPLRAAVWQAVEEVLMQPTTATTSVESSSAQP
jgi:CubicO group peptidase (beta-lactamase class C family)